MAKYIEVLKDGLTVARKVQMAGARVQLSHDFPLQTKKEQTARWGAPRYREITEEDFIGTGGVVKGAVPAGMFVTPAETAAAAAEEVPEPEDISEEEAAAIAEAAEVPEPEAGEVPGAEAAGAVASVDKFAALAGLNVEETLQVVADFDEDTVAEFAAWEQENASRKGVLEPLGYESEE